MNHKEHLKENNQKYVQRDFLNRMNNKDMRIKRAYRKINP